MSTCNRLNLKTPGSQLIMPKNLPDHWVARQYGTHNKDAKLKLPHVKFLKVMINVHRSLWHEQLKALGAQF